MLRAVDEFRVTFEPASASVVPPTPDQPLHGPPGSLTGAPATAGPRRNRFVAMFAAGRLFAADVLQPRRVGDVLFVEVFRLFLVIAGVIGGLAIGNHMATTGP
jgi:hypothetical protein